MVIHDDSERPVEVSVIKKPLYEHKSYVFGKNLERITASNENDSNLMTKHGEKSQELSGNMLQERARKTKKKSKKNSFADLSSTDTDENMQRCSEIRQEDLDELKSVYYKCKSVIKKIEQKYGHILDLDTGEPSRKRLKKSNEHQEEDQCTCSSNKKILFDDEGKEVIIDTQPDIHICPQKLDRSQYKPDIANSSIQIEYQANDIQLSENLQELADILKDPGIESTYRNKVIDKMRIIKLEHSNDIKFNKQSLVEKIKSNPDEIIDFKGANLSALSGYTY